MSLLMRGALAAVGIAIAVSGAWGADLPRSSYNAPSVYKAPAYVMPSAPSWSGLYLGINAGYGFGKSNWDVPAIGTSPKGYLVGPTLGYNFQTGSVVFGLEGDYDFSGMKNSAACGAGTCESSNTWLATVRGRLGYAGFDNWLFYVTGGGAFGNIKASNSLAGNASASRFGYALGGGVEYALWSSWSVKLEYLYVDLGKFDCGVACGAATDNVGFKANTVRAGINYRF